MCLYARRDVAAQVPLVRAYLLNYSHTCPLPQKE